nr:endothelial differentiation-related factor 1 [Camelus dromedarius]
MGEGAGAALTPEAPELRGDVASPGLEQLLGAAGDRPPRPPACRHGESDWDTVTVLRKKGPTAAQAKTQQAILAAQRRGEDVETSKKWAAGQNKQHSITKNTAKLDRETEELHHDRVTLEVGKVIQQGRQSKGLTQKDLATKINEKPQVIADYESGRAIPNNQVLGKIERAIGLKLRGKDVGKPIEKGPRAK